MSKKHADEWGTAPRTLAVLEEVNQRKIHSKYLHILWKRGRLDRRQIDGRTFEYNLTQAKNIRIAEKKGAGRRPTSHEEKNENRDL